MSLSPDVERWLESAGYRHHCFISYPKTQNEELTDCAKQVKEAIEQDLSFLIPKPDVFLDDSTIRIGDEWKKSLKTALCKSICMVAICAPIYYHPKHIWCGKEWAAMERLSQKRIPAEDFGLVIPIIVRMSDPIPQPVSKIQHFDLSRVTTSTRHFYKTKEFKLKIRAVVERIEQIALAIARNQAKTDCGRFRLPAHSAFSKYQPKPRPFPLRTT